MIHIIDDDVFVRRGFSLLFKSAGLNSDSFGSAEEFLSGFKNGESDIVLLDMHMPGMNGCDFLEYLAKHEIYIPVIVITAYDEPASRECAKRYGAIAYLRKPVDGEALIDLVKYTVNPV
jgi:FixJ family two-component response regulator